MAKRSPKSAGSLFDGQSRLLFATNRANVLPILSSGLIRSRAAYEKYYDDLLAHCPGNILLFHGGLPRSLVPLLSGSETGLFPVLVEVDPKRLPTPVTRTRIRTDLSVAGSDDSTGSGSLLCDAVGAPIPIAAVTRLCFASQDDLDDFKAREFENVPALPPLAVVASAFTDGGPEPERFKAVLQSVPSAAGSSEDFRRLDATMGAIAMLSLLLPPSKLWLDAMAVTVSYPTLGKIVAAGAPSWLKSLVERTIGTKPPEVGGVGVDDRLMAAAIGLLRSSNPRDGWVEAQVVSDIASRAAAGAAPAATKEIESWRDVVIAVAKADKQAGSLDDAGSLVRRGLMLLVLRCQPERIMRAGETPLKPGPQVAAVAGMLSGLFHGYSRLSRDIKTQACPVDLLSRLAICWWSAVDGQTRKLAISTSTQREDPTTTRIALSVDRAVLLERVICPSDAMMRLFYHAKGVGYALEYEPELDAFSFQMGGEGSRKRRIIIEPGRPTSRGQATMRVRTACLSPEGKPIRLSKREDAVELLERNYDPVTQCRYAVEPVTGNVELLVHQMLETMDSPELQSHVDAVCRTADEFEAYWASRPATEPRRPGKTKVAKAE